ncbi:hypothetical protein BR93DRAFT_628458 [Coniochaeta sp. PMI_546]|nr:hypothetical protein BR93DRAFT_628458 [Coniochaeta sp. PMI_546]
MRLRASECLQASVRVLLGCTVVCTIIMKVRRVPVARQVSNYRNYLHVLHTKGSLSSPSGCQGSRPLWVTASPTCRNTTHRTLQGCTTGWQHHHLGLDGASRHQNNLPTPLTWAKLIKTDKQTSRGRDRSPQSYRQRNVGQCACVVVGGVPSHPQNPAFERRRGTLHLSR